MKVTIKTKERLVTLTVLIFHLILFYFMARINVSVPPSVLSDQHLIAESVEITMITGSIRKDGYVIKGSVPDQFCLGTGHINFFKPKLQYLKERLEEVNLEMRNRGFNPSTTIDLVEFQGRNCQCKSWKPSFQDSCIVRQRIIERLKSPMKAKSGFHKYYGKPIENMDEFCNELKKSKLFYV